MAGVVEDISGWTLALVRSQSIYTYSVQAYIRSKFLALVDILAHVVRRVESHPARANTLREHLNVSIGHGQFLQLSG